MLLWLARFPIENNHPRPLTGQVAALTHISKHCSASVTHQLALISSYLPQVGGCVAAGEVLTVLEDEKLPRVFQKLVTEGFLGVPVVDSEHRFSYFVDMLDLVHYVCDMFQECQTYRDTLRADSSRTAHTTQCLQHALSSSAYGCSLLCRADMQGSNEVFYVPSEPRLKEDWSRFFQLDRYQNATVREVAARSRPKMPPSYPSFRGFATFSAVEQMARLGPHRVAVLDREKRVVGILTQSMVISLLDQNVERLGQFRDCKVREMVPALASQAICVPETSLTIDAFRLMATNVTQFLTQLAVEVEPDGLIPACS